MIYLNHCHSHAILALFFWVLGNFCFVALDMDVLLVLCEKIQIQNGHFSEKFGLAPFSAIS